MFKGFILSEYIEPNLSTPVLPVLFLGLRPAQECMAKRVAQATDANVDEVLKDILDAQESGYMLEGDTAEYYVGGNCASAENKNHDNCEWKIHEVELP